MVGVEPTALDGHGVGVHVGRDHLELAWAERWKLRNEVLVATAFLQQMPNLLYVLRLGESTDEGRVGLSEDFVVDIADVLSGQNARYTVLSRLFENEFDEVFGGGISWMRREIGSHFVHEEQQFEFSIGRLLGEHPIVEFSRQFLDEVLLLVLVLNRVQVDDVQWNFPGNSRLNKRIDVNGHAVGEEQLVHARGKGCKPASKVVSR